MRLALLAGGTGGAKLAAGLVTLLAPDQLTIIANTADDDEFWSLLVSPDVDAILYRLAGVFNERTGFGVADDTFNALA
ncbi:MAG TPA: 2-phospho-L-lactate transferase CofD family protein, partial [Candidatus Acidoferrales bacterium]|nr:2-phospho-L-lactate transferase CofD family protein [Candidatus Acidoferrales bacterium]